MLLAFINAVPDTFEKTSLKRSTKHGSGEELVLSLVNSFPLRARVRALWGLSGWRGNERIADSIKKGPLGARAGGGCCIRKRSSASFQGSAGRQRNPVRGLAQLASHGFIACPASKLRHTCSDHCCRMGADCRELDGPLRPTARLSAIGTFARSTRARQANRFAERPEFCDQYARDRGSAETVPRFPAESYSLPILSFPLQPLRPHNARTRARAKHIQVQRFHHCGPD